ncbi:hypothetical protein M9H77_15934 [Catharanthus roseus]|uniref:Uncharacterized protein n=1 Tax=Catharanthus roseus TaxID=4058 RepID=A0ACC0AZM9_CATRO|nr:hypothetical protein M9H77_15934 [Catharanthus roseus]
MADLLAFSQSSLFLLPKYKPHSSVRGWNGNAQCLATPSAASSHLFGTRSIISPMVRMQKREFIWGIRAGVVSDSATPTTFGIDSAGEEVDHLPQTAGGGGGEDGNKGGGGGGGGNNNDGDNGNSGASGEGKDHDAGSSKKNTALSMSQKLTLGYAILVGAGGVIGYLKSGSQKSLLSGGLSAALLYYVYTLLPTKPVIASSLGFGLSAALLGVMGSRFKKSGKIFPAGIVSFVSLIMSGGYLHGIMRSAH